MYTAVARSHPKNIVMLRSRRTRIVILIFKGVTATKSLRNNKARQVAPLGPF